MDDTVLSVCLITYNHEKFIKGAIEGVLNQKVNFSWNLIIADDCSTDGTREILLDYQAKYPDFIHLILQERNVGPAKNWIDLITYPQSKYIAYFEGDDYWTDHLKLQKQVDVMEANEDFSMCFHNAIIKDEDKAIEDKLFCNGFENLQVFTIRDVILKNWFCPSVSIVYRNDRLKLPKWASKIYNGDLLMHLLFSSNGNIVYLNESMAVYRQSIGNLTSKKKSIAFYNNRLINLLLKFNKYTNYRYTLDINRRIGQLYLKTIYSMILYVISKAKQLKFKPAGN